MVSSLVPSSFLVGLSGSEMLMGWRDLIVSAGRAACCLQSIIETLSVSASVPIRIVSGNADAESSACDGPREWIATHTVRSGGKELVFAITLKDGSSLIGSMGLRDIDTEHSQAELGFWIGLDWWGQGFATEAGRAVIRFAFEQLNLNRVHAHHMVRNPASGRVLEKIGMRQEGVLRQRVKKWGVLRTWW